jgi:hypothetical protein
MAARRIDRERLASDLASLDQLDLSELRQRWLDHYGRPAPAGFRTQFLIQCIGFKLQEQALGGLKPSVKRLLARTAESGQPVSNTPVGRSGTVLIREWHGKSHQCSASIWMRGGATIWMRVYDRDGLMMFGVIGAGKG